MSEYILKNKKYFTDKGLFFDDDDFYFHNKNLLIGKNGAGKTRFLKALQKYYMESTEKVSVVTLFFPEINIGAANVSTSLYDIIFDNEKVTEDFLKVASKDSLSLLDDIYTTFSLKATKKQEKLKKDFDKLNSYFTKFFFCELKKDKIDGKIHMVKRYESESERIIPIEQAISEFSPGELMLFYLSIFFFYLNHLTSEKIILLIDEPELHLHPKALVALMEMLMSSEVVSCLWVASHSLFIMPIFPFETTIYFKQNHICTLNRNTYKEIYNDLIGLENVELYELLRSVENWSYYRFIVENFFLPESVSKVRKNDEQVNKFLSYVKAIQAKEPIKVLDFGAGKFRLWDCIKQVIPEVYERNSLIKYEAYEPYPEMDAPDNIMFYQNESLLKNDYYDIVVLMNVLHEIDPIKWKHTFNLIKNKLKSQGVIVLLEVFTLSSGEQPYSNSGFLVLQDSQVKILFPTAYKIKMDDQIKEKTNCWIVSKKELSDATDEKIKYAVSSLESFCEKKLKVLDDERIKIAQNKNLKNNIKQISAREYAFWSQQYINAHFATKRLNTSKSLLFGSLDDNNDKLIFPGV